MKKPRVLEVSDSLPLREMNTAICERLGFEVIQAGDGETGLRIFLKKRPFALVLTDLYWYDESPEPPLSKDVLRDGVQFARAIREISPGQPVVIHTSEEKIKDSSLPVLRKPYKKEDLESVVLALVSSGRFV